MYLKVFKAVHINWMKGIFNLIDKLGNLIAKIFTKLINMADLLFYFVKFISESVC